MEYSLAYATCKNEREITLSAIHFNSHIACSWCLWQCTKLTRAPRVPPQVVDLDSFQGVATTDVSACTHDLLHPPVAAPHRSAHQICKMLILSLSHSFCIWNCSIVEHYEWCQVPGLSDVLLQLHLAKSWSIPCTMAAVETVCLATRLQGAEWGGCI